MDFKFTEAQEMLRNTIREFLNKECPRESLRKWDEEGRIPTDVIQKFKGLGILGLYVPIEYGGVGGTPIVACCETGLKACVSFKSFI